MKRRDFMKVVTTGAAAAMTRTTYAEEHAIMSPLPGAQDAPNPQIGTHWPLFEEINTRCQPAMSFLNDEYHDVAAWVTKARATLLGHLHYEPAKCDPNPEVVERADCGTYTRERVLISIVPGARIPAYVLAPKGLKKPAPAMVALHDHGGFYFWGKEKIVEVAPEHPALTEYKKCYGGRSIADELARRGFVVIAADALHWGERGMYFEADPERIKKRTLDVTKQDILEFNARSWAHEELIERTAMTCGTTWAGINVRSDMRVADYLLSRPEVDPQRVGCIGLSLGSVRSIFLGAAHEQIKAAVAVCWMGEYSQMARNNVRNSIGFTKLVPGLYNDLAWPDLAGLHLPGYLMTINGLKDGLYSLKAQQDAVQKVERIYAKAGQSDHYQGVFFDGPHEFNVEMQERAFAWLGERLA
ncbi:MAG: hypothetical protein HZB26_12615 [Candidatus Hydrogenedentes bacterium]|nr:hypothetical protein [Candidatus Hydrogenedentota bacterium]